MYTWRKKCCRAINSQLAGKLMEREQADVHSNAAAAQRNKNLPSAREPHHQ